MSDSPESAALLTGVRRFLVPASFYDRPAEVVARELLGVRIVSTMGGWRCAAEIVETEAYVGPADEASHAHERFGRTARNSPMFGPPGSAYIYRIYGIHLCLNAVACREGFPAAVLIRAAQPLDGIEQMRRRRPGRPDRDLLRGPGNLCRGLGVDLSLNGHRLEDPPLIFERGSTVGASSILAGPRVGISRAVEAPLRFAIRGSRWVSGRPPPG